MTWTLNHPKRRRAALFLLDNIHWVLWITAMSLVGVASWLLHLGYATYEVGHRTRHGIYDIFFRLPGWSRAEMFWHVPSPPMR